MDIEIFVKFDFKLIKKSIVEINSHKYYIPSFARLFTV